MGVAPPRETNGAVTLPPSETTIADSASLPTTVTAVPLPDDDGSVVRGRVIDFWGHAIANAAVGIGNTRTTTDEDGRFEFRGIGPSYDISLVVRFRSDVVEVYGWRYEGLTRRDPTLQIYKGLPQREGRVRFDVKGVSAAVQAEAALGGVDGHRAFRVSSAEESLVAWRGTQSVTASMHALSWTAPEGARIPVTYLAHATQEVVLSEQELSLIPIDLTSTSVLDVANVTGSVNAARDKDRVHLMFARFDQGPSLLLVSEARAAAADSAFRYAAPKLEGMTLTLAVREDSKVAQGEYTVGYVSQVVPGDDAGVIDVRASAQLLLPADDATDVTLETTYSWETDAGTSVIVFDDLQVFQAVYVVTSNKHARLPDLTSLGLYYSNSGAYTWAVESHGVAQSVDELAGERGFLDPFSGDHSYPMGINHGQGRFSRSVTRALTTGKVNDSPFAR